ncbi:MAG TPA: NAD(P)H-dependent glycerol-3-phosphate dehydrogenase [Spirochaetia bacterium]|nr:NAD(P)H-dependent glycerol-3-phosphate dehydrogenase [Spirochaetia bacterium]
MDKTVGILSAGAWGTAMGKILAEKGIDVTVWDYVPEVVHDINTLHINGKYLPGVVLPEKLKAVANMEEAVSGKDFLIIASPSLYLLQIIKQLIQFKDIQEGKVTIGVLTKGFLPSPAGPRLILESMEDYLPGFYRSNLVYISGPSHAEEVSRGKLTGLISASSNPKNSIRFRELISSRLVIVFSSLDVAGVQTCAASKNVIAIAFGMLDALLGYSDVFGDNTESLLLAAGLNEIQTLGQALGSTHPETFTSIAGVGDLDVTCRSKYGRNRRFGKQIIEDNILYRYTNLDDLIENIHSIGYLPEGVIACKYVQQIAEKYKLRLPISSTVYKILNKEADPFEAIREVLSIL